MMMSLYSSSFNRCFHSKIVAVKNWGWYSKFISAIGLSYETKAFSGLNKLYIFETTYSISRRHITNKGARACW